MEIKDVKSPYLFISYAHKNTNTVLPILQRMEKDGYRIWYDQGIEAGSEWPANIAAHLRAAEAIVVFMSNDTVDSRNCRNEINLALEKKKEVLVVYIEDTDLRHGLDLQLGTSQSLFFHRYPDLDGFMRILNTLTVLAPCRERGNEQAAEPDKKPLPSAVKTPTQTTDTPSTVPCLEIKGEHPVLLVGLGGIGTKATLRNYLSLYSVMGNKLSSVTLDIYPDAESTLQKTRAEAEKLASAFQDGKTHIRNILLESDRDTVLSRVLSSLSPDENLDLYDGITADQSNLAYSISGRRFAYLTFRLGLIRNQLDALEQELVRLAELGKGKVSVNVIATPMGNFGSGTLLAVSRLIRDLAAQNRIFVTLRAFLASTDILDPLGLENTHRIRHQANAYATLKELAAFSDPTLPTSTRVMLSLWKRTADSSVFDTPAYDTVLWIPKTHYTGSLSDGIAAFADTVSAKLLTDCDQDATSLKALRPQTPDFEVISSRQAFFPCQEILHGAARLLASDFSRVTALYRYVKVRDAYFCQKNKDDLPLSSQEHDEYVIDYLSGSDQPDEALSLVNTLYEITDADKTTVLSKTAPRIQDALTLLHKACKNTIEATGMNAFFEDLLSFSKENEPQKPHLFTKAADAIELSERFGSYKNKTLTSLNQQYLVLMQKIAALADTVAEPFLPFSNGSLLAPLFQKNANTYFSPDVTFIYLFLFRRALRKDDKGLADPISVEETVTLPRSWIACPYNGKTQTPTERKSRYYRMGEYRFSEPMTGKASYHDLSVLRKDIGFLVASFFERVQEQLFIRVRNRLLTALDEAIDRYRLFFQELSGYTPILHKKSYPPHTVSIYSEQKINETIKKVVNEVNLEIGIYGLDNAMEDLGRLMYTEAIKDKKSPYFSIAEEAVQKLTPYYLNSLERGSCAHYYHREGVLCFLMEEESLSLLHDLIEKTVPSHSESTRVSIVFDHRDQGLTHLKNYSEILKSILPDGIRAYLYFETLAQSSSYRTDSYLNDPVVRILASDSSYTLRTYPAFHEEMKGAELYAAYREALQKMTEIAAAWDPHLFPAFSKPSQMPMIHPDAEAAYKLDAARAFLDDVITERVTLNETGGSVSVAMFARNGKTCHDRTLSQKGVTKLYLDELYDTPDSVSSGKAALESRIQAHKNATEKIRFSDSFNEIYTNLLTHPFIETLCCRLGEWKNGGAFSLARLAYAIENTELDGFRRYFDGKTLFSAGLSVIRDIIRDALSQSSGTTEDELFQMIVSFMCYYVENEPLDGTKKKALIAWIQKNTEF